jgi:hypothetical protein
MMKKLDRVPKAFIRYFSDEMAGVAELVRDSYHLENVIVYRKIGSKTPSFEDGFMWGR